VRFAIENGVTWDWEHGSSSVSNGDGPLSPQLSWNG